MCIKVHSFSYNNSYDFQLTTLMVIDDSYQGFPCIFMLSNRIDQVAMEVMFNEVKKKICVLKSKVFMSDMANAYSNALEAVFGKPEHRLFCSWHVDKA